MTDYTAYDAGLPCKNPHCKSYGKPHPNCRCYADGGDVTFCDEARAHKPECQYFQDGGDVDEEVPAGMIPPGAGAVAAPVSAPEPPNYNEDPSQLVQDEEVPADKIPPGAGIDEEVPADKIPKNAGMREPADEVGEPGIAVMEGAGKGALSVLPGMAETALSKLGVPNIAPEDQARRLHDYPLQEGVGEATGFMMGPGLLINGLRSTGAKILATAVSNGLIPATDEYTKSVLGIGDPNETVAGHIANAAPAAMLGLGLQAAGLGAVPAAQWLKIGTKMMSSAAGIGAAAAPESEAALMHLFGDQNVFKYAEDAKIPDFNKNYYEAGKVMYRMLTSVPAKMAATAAGAWAGGGKPFLQHVAELAGIGGLPFTIERVAEKIAPTMLRVMSTAPEEALWGNKLQDALNFTLPAASGLDKIAKSVKSLVKGGSQEIVDNSTEALKGPIKKIKDWIEKGGANQILEPSQQPPQEEPHFAEGGAVKKRPVPSKDDGPNLMSATMPGAEIFSAENQLLNTARGRVTHYLSSLRPAPYPQKLPYDSAANEQDQQHKTYERAIKLAASPLTILQDIRDGTIEQESLKHLTSLYPEIHAVMSRHMTKQIAEDQLTGHKPPIHIRDGMGLFLGAHLTSEQTPRAIQAAQQALQLTRAASQEEQKPAPKAKNSKTPLSKVSQGMQTTGQSLVSRQQRQS